ncbi:MAG: DUF6323 family protein [Lachnospiraceae bacterium]
MEEKDMLWQISESSQLVKLTATNQYTNRFGLTLSDEDALMLVQERRDILKEQQRVEFGEGILPKLIFAFCDSAYIYQENYVEMIGRLQEIFYLYKNESMDEVTDDELISYMKERFEGECMGSLDYLEDTCLEEFARNIRRKTQKFIGRYSKDEE